MAFYNLGIALLLFVGSGTILIQVGIEKQNLLIYLHSNQSETPIFAILIAVAMVTFKKLVTSFVTAARVNLD